VGPSESLISNFVVLEKELDRFEEFVDITYDRDHFDGAMIDMIAIRPKTGRFS
jgi:hypothetical protein